MERREYVWELPVRLTHWINAACLVLLSFTGIYINRPFLAPSSVDPYLMGWMRFVHFSTAYVFVVNLAVRIYWSFAGNSYAGWRSLFPFGSERVSVMLRQMSFYLLRSSKPPQELGHAPLAGLLYFLLLVVCAISAATGFALYSLNTPGGASATLFGWVFSLFGIAYVRLIHHFVMWVLLYFLIVHLYMVFFLNAVEKNGLLGSIFDGYKTVEPGSK